MRAVTVFALVAVAACHGVPAAFHCTSSAQCTLDGKVGACEADGACSLPDTTCASGRRYVYAGGASGTCVAVVVPAWTAEASGSVALLRGVWGSSGRDIYVVGDGGTILHSTGDGTWTPETSPNVVRLDGVAGASATDVYISGNLNTLLHGNGTGTWTAVGMSTHPPFDILSSLFYATPRLVYAVGDLGFILHSDGQGGWAQDTSGTMGWLYQIWGSAATDLYTAGDGGIVLHGDGSGAWTVQPSGTSATLFGVWGASAGEVWAVGASATALVSHGDGAWSAVDLAAATSGNFWGVFGDAMDRFIVGDGGVVLHSSDGATWTAETSGTAAMLRRGWVSPERRAYVVGDLGTILHRDL